MMQKKYRILFYGLLLWLLSIPVAAQDLLQFYELALQRDPVLKQADANRLAVGESDNQGIARLLPTLNLSADHSRNYLNNTKRRPTYQGSGAQAYWNSGFELNLTQPVFHWDYWVQLDQADNQIAQAEALYQAELQNLMMRVAEAYFNILAEQDNLTFTQAEKNAFASQLEKAEESFKVGMMSMTDVYEARAAHDRAKADEIGAKNQVNNSKERLREIVGPIEIEPVPLEQQLPLRQPEPDNIDAWSQIAENQNLNILAVLNEAEVARKTIDLQQSAHYPVVDIVGAYSVTDNDSSFGLRGDQQRIGVQLNMPLFTGGAINSRTRQAQHEYEQAREKLTETRRSVDRQVKDAYRGVITSISQVEALKVTEISMQNALEATQAGFAAGTRTMVDVVRSQQDLYQAKRDYARSRYDYLINGLKLKQAASIATFQDLESINQLLGK
ncbi:TolC family outer membrane protein [Methylobacter sp. YRD-M1]|uniref:TolC family outer membrane protein n=1 Tax=Methylobacter sp. YRD-M1 TaxID=2911520 RepID=UPI00227A9CD5|nr:TolC family outer membrane protein [Methylobacter sp. YRD-M1]WAK00682.1 TolC family outer membrane protein [Methylobacter sp. YRD-M1]